MTRRSALALCAATLASRLAGEPLVSAASFAYGTSIDGNVVRTLAAGDARLIVAVFIATDCPISNRYLPSLAQSATQYQSRGVRMWLVYPNPGDTLARVRLHRSEYPAAADVPQLVAPAPGFVAHAHVHVTPEAALFRAESPMQQPILWHGRIDDRYLSFGTERPAARHHDLADAVEAVLAGRHPKRPDTPPVGCAIIPAV